MAYPFDGPEGMGSSSPYPYVGYVGARRDERSASQGSAAFQGFSPSPNKDSNASSTVHASEAGFLSSLSAHSFLLPSLHSSASTLDPFEVGRGQNTFNNGGGDYSFYSTNILNAPGTFPWAQPMPDGYEQIIPSRGSVSDWEKGLTLDARYNFYYQRKIESVSINLPCPLCAQDMLGCNIRQHLRENHRGYCQKGKVKCFACGPLAREMNAKSYPDHVREKHCHLSVLCPYCLGEMTRGESVTRHCIRYCEALATYRKRV
ncbi:hypothetical protein ARMSODRAFT_1090575 [Armillaria solidipes]|uniref:Uncharacterized protein n=1 Tax=Armillaria solidipes TaxID=1076256 RepID=A0A2H3B7P8_9AGAR|nr:hypothetical protein ARMSODRAFT_1090575 [Armillaria solidipes]